MSATLTAAEVLEAAAKYIEQHGWIQGSYCHMASGRVCMQGACNRVVEGHAALYAAWEKLTDYLGQTPESFNDWPGRTKAEVIAALRAAARQE